MSAESPLSITEWLVIIAASVTSIVGGVVVPYLTTLLLASSVVQVIVAPDCVMPEEATADITGSVASVVEAVKLHTAPSLVFPVESVTSAYHSY